MKSNHWKKTASILAVVALVVGLLAGCSGKGGNTSSTPSTPPSGSAPSESVKLVFWNNGLKSTDDTGTKKKDELALFRYVKKFEEENPGVTIEVVDKPADNIATLLKAASVSKDGPDLIGLWAGGATNDFKHLLVPLDPYLTNEEKAQYSGLDIAKTDYKPDGQVQALPYNVTTYHIFYNKAAFKKAGVELPTSVKTWDEFMKLCERLKQGGVTPLYVGEKEGYVSTWAVSELLLDEIGPEGILKLRTGEQKFDSPEFKKAMGTWKQVYDKKYTNKDFVTLGAWDSMQQFADSGAAMTVNGSWTINDLTTQLGDDLGTIQFPAISADAPYADYLVSQPGSNISVTKFSKYPDIAAKFAKFITSGQFQIDYYKDTGDIPSNTSADLSQITNPITKQALEWIKTSKTGLGFDALISADAAGEFYKLASAVVYSKTTVDEMAKSIDAKIK
ncbi:ABC transporter substrate-binding protein [Paenibacillus sp. GCM10012307]|uniref:Extracellular solute-binding protein n=1 Tax=Paenibacillus roseus TaxID=2798579 RepID=A0A934J6W7_9BACL|nr:extracellular solute-binding protein [Paenibacillus roseus]MBJ6361492.1 extracellular solute-binding protein [Paenibacillus roseus]